MKAEDITGYLSGAAITGGSAAILLNLLRQFKDAHDERVHYHKLDQGKIPDDTLFINIPTKRIAELKERDRMIHEASAREQFANDEPEDSKEIFLTDHDGRDSKGRFSPKWVQLKEKQKNLKTKSVSEKTAASGFKKGLIGIGTTLGALGLSDQTSDEALENLGATAAVTAGVPLAFLSGYYVLDKISKHIEKRRLRKQIDAAQQVFLGKLTHSSDKKAEFEKSAKVETPSGRGPAMSAVKDTANTAVDIAEKGVGVTLGVGTLIALSGAYLAKKYLDSKYKHTTVYKEPTNRVRVMFRSSDQDDDEKDASFNEVSPEHALAFIDLATTFYKNTCSTKSAEQVTQPSSGSSFFGGIVDKAKQAVEPIVDAGKSFYSDKTLQNRYDTIAKDPAKLESLRHAVIRAQLKGDNDYGEISSFFHGNNESDGDKKMPALSDHDKEIVANSAKKLLENDFNNNKDEYFRLLGDAQHNELRDSAAGRVISDHINNWFGKNIPFLKDSLLQKAIAWIASKLSGSFGIGSRMQAGAFLKNKNKDMSVDDFGKIMNGYNFTGKGWTKKSSFTEELANMTILRDRSNAELADKLDMIADQLATIDEQTKKKKKKTFKRELEGVDVYANDEILKELMKNKEFKKWIKANNGTVMA